ncbi:hypothetical protein EUX98_g2974 [Antrodiella citrinella]|uniref:Aminoglycoside phosphotransferase domain-containing protein n=1 Tax=Antrodiella citrinella TaxID=2447956 RepID=A0A4S4MZ04_9APHY|nr:hypothetical protein EUX98_g2974 [Antrodiella citrinella]
MHTRSRSHSPGASQPPDIWLPSTYEELDALLRTSPIYEGYLRAVVQSADGVLFKYKGPSYAEEVRAMRYAGRLIPSLVPKILHHPPLHRGVAHARRDGRPTGVWYICMEKCPGVSLDKVIDNMTPYELNHVAEQLRTVLDKMQRPRSKKLGSVTGGPFRNNLFPDELLPYRPSTYSDLINLWREILLVCCSETHTENLLSRLPRNAPIRFAHGDLLPQNIIVNGSTITGIIDWVTAGFWPEYWDYCVMHDPDWSSPGWDRILEILFVGKRRQAEINAVHEISEIFNRLWYG